MKQLVMIVSLSVLALLTACVGGSRAMRSGGEVTGQRSVNYNEPTPFGMVEVKQTLCGASKRRNAKSRWMVSGWTKRK